MTTVASPTSERTSRSATLSMPSGSTPPLPVASAAGGHAEEHEPADPGRHGVDGGLAQRVAGVLDDPGHRPDRRRLGGALLHEHRQHELARAQGGLGDEPPQRRRGAQPAGPVGREGHHPSVRGYEVLLQGRSVESSPSRRMRRLSMSASLLVPAPPDRRADRVISAELLVTPVAEPLVQMSAQVNRGQRASRSRRGCSDRGSRASRRARRRTRPALPELAAGIAHVAVRAARQDPRRGSVLLGPAQARPQRRDVGLQRIDPLVALLRLAHVPDVTGAATAPGPVREI